MKITIVKRRMKKARPHKKCKRRKSINRRINQSINLTASKEAVPVFPVPGVPVTRILGRRLCGPSSLIRLVVYLSSTTMRFVVQKEIGELVVKSYPVSRVAILAVWVVLQWFMTGLLGTRRMMARLRQE
jgi:hypothetical protein